MTVVVVATVCWVSWAGVALANDALVGYWKFDETTAGAPVVDSSGNGGVGTTQGAGGQLPTPSSVVPTVSFPDPLSLSFNSSDQEYVRVPNPSDGRYTLSSATFSTWVKFNAPFTNNWEDFIAKRTTNGGQVEYQWGYDPASNQFKMTFASNGASGGDNCCTDVDFNPSSPLHTGQWYLITTTFASGSGTLTWYIDGSQAYTTTVPAGVGFGSDSGAELDLGSSYSGSGEFLNGELDETRIYNYTLDQSQITAMAEGASGPNVSSSGAVVDPQPTTTVDCSSQAWTSGQASCAIGASEQDVASGDPDPPTVSSIFWSSDGGSTWHQVTGFSATVDLPAVTAVTPVEAYAVDSVLTQGPTTTATAYQDSAAPTVSLTASTGALSGQQQITGQITLPTVTQTNSAPSIGVVSAVIRYRFAGQQAWSTACTLTAPTTGPGACEWQTSQVDNGAYELQEVATDTVGNAGVSPVQDVTIDNPTPPSSTSTTPSSTASTTSTTTTTTTSESPASDSPVDAVTLPSSAVLAGLHTSGSGSVSFALQCPAVVDGNCEASGTLSITLPSSSASSADAMAAAQRTTTTVLARLTGVQISSGEQQFVAVKLSRSAITYLRAHGIYRARATLSLTTTLQSGAVIRSSQHVWLYVSALTGCQSATGTLSPGRVGSLKLGMTRAQAHRTGRYTHAAHGLERYCIAHGKTRVAYATKALTHHARTGRAMLILTANHRYTIHGITVRMSVKAARHQGLRLSRPITVGKNAWYLIRSKHATWVLKVQDGTIREIGITTRALTHTPTQQRTLLHQL